MIDSLKEIVRSVDPASLYQRADDLSAGEQILRSAAAIEQTFGGLTANLWDDPFEWTLPETLSTSESIDGDGALSKYVAVPSGESKTLIELLLETLVRASEYRGRAAAATKRHKNHRE